VRERPAANFDAARFEMDGKHHLKLIDKPCRLS
jgi:hypothetical protein